MIDFGGGGVPTNFRLESADVFIYYIKATFEDLPSTLNGQFSVVIRRAILT